MVRSHHSICVALTKKINQWCYFNEISFHIPFFPYKSSYVIVVFSTCLMKKPHKAQNFVCNAKSTVNRIINYKHYRTWKKIFLHRGKLIQTQSQLGTINFAINQILLVTPCKSLGGSLKLIHIIHFLTSKKHNKHLLY